MFLLAGLIKTVGLFRIKRVGCCGVVRPVLVAVEKLFKMSRSDGPVRFRWGNIACNDRESG
jgi:hypothetical protein